MALVESLNLPMGSPLKPFRLPDPDGREYSSGDLTAGKGLLIGFLCNHCPYAIAVWPRFIALADAFRDQGIHAVAINPNIHPDYPEDSPENMLRLVRDKGVDFPYLVDESQDVARAFKAQCTPDIYLYACADTPRLVYHGRIDDNWQDESAVKRHDLREALEAVVQGRPVPEDQSPAMGCSIKWKN